MSLHWKQSKLFSLVSLVVVVAFVPELSEDLLISRIWEIIEGMFLISYNKEWSALFMFVPCLSFLLFLFVFSGAFWRVEELRGSGG